MTGNRGHLGVSLAAQLCFLLDALVVFVVDFWYPRNDAIISMCGHTCPVWLGCPCEMFSPYISESHSSSKPKASGRLNPSPLSAMGESRTGRNDSSLPTTARASFTNNARHSPHHRRVAQPFPNFSSLLPSLFSESCCLLFSSAFSSLLFGLLRSWSRAPIVTRGDQQFWTQQFLWHLFINTPTKFLWIIFPKSNNNPYINNTVWTLLCRCVMRVPGSFPMPDYADSDLPTPENPPRLGPSDYTANLTMAYKWIPTAHGLSTKA